MGNYKRSAALISALGAVIAAAVGGYFVVKGGNTVIVQLPDKQQEALGFREAGERIERLSRDLADAKNDLLNARSKLYMCLKDPPRGEDEEDPVPPDPPKPPMTQVVDEFSFEFRSCEASGSSLVCPFFVTNKAGDRRLQIGSRSRIVTASGQEFRAEERELGSKRGQGIVDTELVRGIRTRGALHLFGVAPLSGSIQLVEIWCWAPNGYFSVQFRDVPI